WSGLFSLVVGFNIFSMPIQIRLFTINTKYDASVVKLSLMTVSREKNITPLKERMYMYKMGNSNIDDVLGSEERNSSKELDGPKTSSKLNGVVLWHNLIHRGLVRDLIPLIGGHILKLVTTKTIGSGMGLCDIILIKDN
ncbi:hypothetical protein ACJX0J_012600, partial [Zea mays]